MNVTPPMHERITPEQLQRICNLVHARLSTVEEAFAMEFGITRQQVWKCRRVGQKAAEKEERGEELTPGEQRALWMDRELRKAQAHRSHQLTRDALGIEKDGKRNCRNESINAFKMLVLTSESYRKPVDEEEPEEDQNASDDALLAGLQRIKDTRPDLLTAAGLAPTDPPE